MTEVIVLRFQETRLNLSDLAARKEDVTTKKKSNSKIMLWPQFFIEHIKETRLIYSNCTNYNIIRSSHEHFKQNLLHWCTIIAHHLLRFDMEKSAFLSLNHFLSVENAVVLIHTIRNASFLHCLLYHPAHGRIKIHN